MSSEICGSALVVVSIKQRSVVDEPKVRLTTLGTAAVIQKSEARGLPDDQLLLMYPAAIAAKNRYCPDGSINVNHLQLLNARSKEHGSLSSSAMTTLI